MIKKQTNEIIVTKVVEETVTEEGIFISGKHAVFLKNLIGYHIVGKSDGPRGIADEIYVELKKMVVDPKEFINMNVKGNDRIYFLNDKGE